jgi:hypothetical protein
MRFVINGGAIVVMTVVGFVTTCAVLLVEETRVPEENPVASHRQTLSNNVVLSTPPISGIQTHKFSGDRY